MALCVGDVKLRLVPGASVDGETNVLVSAVPPAGRTRTPSDICCVVDISGSMGTEAVIKAGHESEAKGAGLISVLAVVKHATKTIMHNLGDSDRLALVTYANNGELVFGLTACNDQGRAHMERAIDGLVPYGMTNLWDGLKKGLDVLKEGEGQGRLQHIMLFTDGLPNINPPRGILPMLKRLKTSSGGRLPVTLSTFGFGYELDSELLSQLAAEGGGSYAFIPDAGFVGTVFVNAMANILVTAAKNVTIELEELNGAKISKVIGLESERPSPTTVSINLATLQFGQSKDVVVQMKLPTGGGGLKATARFDTPERADFAETCASFEAQDARAVERQRLRLVAVETIIRALRTAQITAHEKASGKQDDALRAAQAVICETVASIRASPAAHLEEIAWLLEDLEGQAMEAVQREDWFTKWGVHFLPSLAFAHRMQLCNNFKDAGVQAYGGELFQSLRDAADEVFLSLPPPRPDAPAAPAAAEAPRAAPAASAAAVDMSIFHDRCGG